MVNHGLYRGRGVGGGDDITSAIGRYFFDCLVVEMFDNRFKLHSVACTCIAKCAIWSEEKNC